MLPLSQFQYRLHKINISDVSTFGENLSIIVAHWGVLNFVLPLGGPPLLMPLKEPPSRWIHMFLKKTVYNRYLK